MVGNFDFIVLNYHAPSTGGSVNPEDDAPLLWPAFTAAPSHVSPTEQDVLLLGDFNQKTPEGFLPSEVLRLVYGGTTSATGGGEPYDTIFIDSRYTRYEYTGHWGINRLPITMGLSDHAVVWARFWTYLEDDD
ncbi:MAG TPA: hypothetical protein P5259_06425 [Candidatus Bipolaricaulis sp.]|nr:hypothetical protein [Rectinema sp.]HRS14605.1 hypothetical protein [Candidatus Bipolaricaulis sp.]HRU22185.1 hypothetical protein [Candidatus Bipolaricaulis sp.]